MSRIPPFCTTMEMRMEGSTSSMTREKVVNEIEEIFKVSMERFKSRCKQRIPFCIISTNTMNSISEHCFLPYFLLGLLTSGFIINDLSTSVEEVETKMLRPFDLLARKYGDEKSIQVKVMAQRNPEGGTKQLLEGISCMQQYTVKYLYSLVSKRLLCTNPDEEFRYSFNMVIMQNWGLPEISDWWASEKPGAAKQRGAKGERSSPYWRPLKLKLLLAKRRGALPLLKSGTGGSLDILYAIFADPLEEPKRDLD